jgi:3-hydroxyisobutyrate dehydrogenase
MGAGMAANQVKAGREVHAFDLSQAAVDKAVAAGCRPAASVAAAVEGADIVISMLPAGAHVRAVYGEQVLAHAPKSALLIDCSTIDVDSARAVGEQARAAGLRFADAPVSGGIMAAEAGTLAFMVGCEAADYPAFEEALTPMARVVFHAGGLGSGQAAKICNNMLLAISMIGTCEAFVLAEKLGLSHETLFRISSTASGQCWSLTSYCPVPGPVPSSPANRDYQAGFTAAMMLKDLKLSQNAAQAAGAATPLGAQATALYSIFESAGAGGKDFSGIIQMLRGHLSS